MYLWETENVAKPDLPIDKKENEFRIPLRSIDIRFYDRF